MGSKVHARYKVHQIWLQAFPSFPVSDMKKKKETQKLKFQPITADGWEALSSSERLPIE